MGGEKDVKPLIVYYSRRGSNLVDGVVRDLKIGNTELLATILQKLTGGDCFRLEPVTDYSPDYYRCIDQARQDLHRKHYPKLKCLPKHLTDYPVIYLGYPNYWGTLPMPVASFLRACDLSGREIRPFCTHEGGGLGRSVADLQALCPGARVGVGLAVQGTAVRQSTEQIKAWVAAFDTNDDAKLPFEKETKSHEKIS